MRLDAVLELLNSGPRKRPHPHAWTISPRMLLFSAQCEHPAIEATILDFCDQIDEELKKGTVILSNLSNEHYEH